MAELILTVLIAAILVTGIVLFVLWILARHRANVGRIDPESMNEILDAERQVQPNNIPRGMDLP